MPQSLCSCSVTCQPQDARSMYCLFQHHGLQSSRGKMTTAHVRSLNTYNLAEYGLHVDKLRSRQNSKSVRPSRQVWSHDHVIPRDFGSDQERLHRRVASHLNNHDVYLPLADDLLCNLILIRLFCFPRLRVCRKCFSSRSAKVIQ